MKTLARGYFVLYILTTITAALCLPGCSTKVNYPSGWAPIESQKSSGTCSPILGQYSQHGMATVVKGPFWKFTDETQPSLLSNLLGVDVYPPDAVTHATLNLSGTEASLSLWIGNELFVSRILKTGELDCESGRWRLDLDWAAWRSTGILLDMGGTFTSLFLHKANDGSLVISKNQKMIGTAILLPVYIKEQNWHRFLPATEVEKHPGTDSPYGVLPPEHSFARLLPPLTQKNRHENPKQQKRCLESAITQFEQRGDNLTPEEATRLQGLFTQNFLAQSNKTAEAYPRTEYLDRTRGHTPSTRFSMLRKPHWLDTSISDRFVLCLFDSGYVWQNVTRTKVEMKTGKH